ncbi:MAG TPA: oligosaccharide flippase family protein [Clostridia bacterium]|nr:oligosaccharide flippase family protein [Clostridia bacterium]
MNLARMILKNTLSNWTGMAVATAITILITPYILTQLGQERYGIYNIVFAVMQYLVLLEFGIRGAVARFASKYIQAKDSTALSSVISLAILFSLIIGLIAIGLSVLIGYAALDFFHVSSLYQTQTLILFVASGLNLMLSFLCYSLSGVLIGSNRYELQNLQIIINNVVRAALIVVFFESGWISLTSWAVAIIVATLASLMYLFVIVFHVQPGLRIGLKNLRPANMKEMFHFGGWNIFLQLSGLLTASANPILIGRLLGSAMVPFYSIPFLLVSRLQEGVSGMTSTLMPHASSTLNTGDKAFLAHLLKRGTYTASLLVFPLGGCLLIMCRSLFRVWLPPQYEDYWVIYAIFMIAYFGSITQTSSYYVLLGGGNIKWMSFVYVGAGFCIVALCLLFVGVFKMGIEGAAIALVIPRFISTCLFQPWFAARQSDLKVFEYLTKAYIRPVLYSIPSLLLAFCFSMYMPARSLPVWIAEYLLALLPTTVFIILEFDTFGLREISQKILKRKLI